MKDKISIVVPIYNVETYLKECIDSILNQTYSNIEVILVDDGSTDNSGKMCDQYKMQDNRICVLHKENGGLSDARNVGINQAKGKYIAFVDSDDVVADDMIEYLFSMINTYKADMSVCQCDYIDETSRLIKNNANVENICISGKEECLKALLGESGLNTVAWGKLYKTEFFKDVRYPVGKYHEDVYTTYKLVEKCNKIVIGNEHKYLYRKRLSSISRHQFSSKHFDSIEGAEKRAEYITYRYKNLKRIAQSTIISAVNHCTLKMIQEKCYDLKYILFLQKKYRKYVWSYLLGKTSIRNKIFTMGAVINLKFVIRMGIGLSNNNYIINWIQNKIE